MHDKLGLLITILVTLVFSFVMSGCGQSGSEEQGPLGFVGGPCQTNEDCEYEGSVCMTSGFQGGLCSLPCDQFCPDKEGYPVTFCVDSSELPGSSSDLTEGGCVSRCHMGIFQDSGCRNGYGCAVVGRYNEQQTQKYACIPDRESELVDCHLELAALGVSFEPTLLEDEIPITHPELTCHVENPVVIFSPVHGVDLRYNDDSIATPWTACQMGHNLALTIDDLKDHGVAEVTIGRTYHCSVIASTGEVSRHGHGDAIDIYGFHLEDGSHYTLVDHWEHDSDSPLTPAGLFLYEASQRWHADYLWNVILTPNYNLDHDNHFHVDLTPDLHFLE
jgi:extensin-like protein